MPEWPIALYVIGLIASTFVSIPFIVDETMPYSAIIRYFKPISDGGEILNCALCGITWPFVVLKLLIYLTIRIQR